MPPPASPAGADLHAFHAHLDEINARRIVPLTLTLMGLLTIAAASGIVATGTVSGARDNLLGIGLSVLQLLLARWSRSPRLRANVFGVSVLAWGTLSATTFANEFYIRHASHAAGALAAFIVTRYLAALCVVWRPKDLGLALIVTHVIVAPVLVAVDGQTGWVLAPIWTFVAWLAAYLIYRAQREAFHARAILQQQHDALAAANTRLEQLNQEKNDLMAIAAHDLRSPLMGMATLLNITADDLARYWTAGVSRIRALEQSCHDMASLVTRVLDAHAAEDQPGQLDVLERDVQPLVARSVESHRARAKAKDIALVLAADGACPALHDEQALSRILDNLVSNAVKFTAHGGTVRVSLGADERGAVISVRDSGPGIKEEDRSRLFRKFARLHARPTGGESSSGLGLYITKRLTEAMGGSIALGNPPVGAEFILSLRGASVGQRPAFDHVLEQRPADLRADPELAAQHGIDR